MVGFSSHFRALALAFLAGGVACAQPAALGPQRGVLLLRNGEMIEGIVTFSGDRYDVELDDGEIHVKSSEVEIFARTPQQCFEHRHANLERDKIEEHLNLAEWCLRHGMVESAAGELKDAVALDAAHPKIALLERRLKLTIVNQPAHGIVNNPAALDVPTVEELDRTVRSLPAGTVETFTGTIQPLLLNHCSTAGCHGPQSQGKLRLARIPAGRVTSRRSTQRNLHAVLSAVDRDRPDESPLLLSPTKPHGTSKSAIFTNRDLLQYKQLVDWVNAVSSASQPKGPATLEEPASPLLQSVTSPQQLTPAGEAGPLAPTDSTPADNSAPQRSAPKRGEPLPGFLPKDPFDPEIFNRRAFGKMKGDG